MNTPILLCSASPYKKALLERLKQTFETYSPDIDETQYNGESANDYVLRVAKEKASVGHAAFPDTIVISSDQIATCKGEVLTKPRNPEHAFEQLTFCSGRTVVFLTGLCIVLPDGTEHLTRVEGTVNYRVLSEKRIRDYLAIEQPYQCAGGIQLECLGISLVESIHCPDPTAIIGLPLIAVSEVLSRVLD